LKTVYHQDWKNCNARVLEKYLNCNKKMIIENEKVEWEEHKEARKQEHERKKLFDWKCLFAQTIDVIDQWKDIKQRL